MKSIDLFYQGEGVSEIAHIELEPDATFATLKARLTEKHGVPLDALVFLEDEDEPFDEVVLRQGPRHGQGPQGPPPPLPPRRGDRHLQRRDGRPPVRRRARPSRGSRRWAAEHKFGMTEEEAGEHVLQIAGTHDRPAPGHAHRLADR